MKNPQRWASIIALGALAVFVGAPRSHAATAPKLPGASSPLALAHTITAHETFSVTDSKGNLHPYFDVTVYIQRPGEVRIQAVPIPTSGKKQEPTSFYLMANDKEYEFNGFENSYTTGPAPAAGALSKSQLWDMAAISPILYPAVVPTNDQGSKRAITTGMLNGVRTIIITDTDPTRRMNGMTETPFSRVWFNASTLLPMQKCEYVKLNSKVMLNLQLEINSIALNQPIAASQFVWTPPAGSKPYAPPTLLRPGTNAPNFTAIDDLGKPVQLSDFRGKTVILDFWATWCGPCQASLPTLQKFYKRLNPSNVVVLAVCVWDNHPAFSKWMTAMAGKYSFHFAFDPAGRGANSIASKLYHVTGIPTQYIIAPDGKVAWSEVGYTGSHRQLADQLTKLGVAIAPAP